MEVFRLPFRLTYNNCDRVWHSFLSAYVCSCGRLVLEHPWSAFPSGLLIYFGSSRMADYLVERPDDESSVFKNSIEAHTVDIQVRRRHSHSSLQHNTVSVPCHGLEAGLIICSAISNESVRK